MLEILEAAQLVQCLIGDLSAIQVEILKVLQTGQVTDPRIVYGRAFKVQALELGQALEVLEAFTGDFRVAQVQGYHGFQSRHGG